MEYFYPTEKLQLHDFNNLTKTLTFNLYDVCITETDKDKKHYIASIDEMYSADRLTEILKNVVNMIGANILSIAKQDYEPQGSSVTILVSEGELLPSKETVVAHLDKSHITVHTYPEHHPELGISTFRADIDVSTCGLISPLKALNYLINEFKTPNIAIIDYKVRGFTRQADGTKIFIDHKIESIQDYITKENKEKYLSVDVNYHNDNTFHTKLMVKDFNINDYIMCTEDEFNSNENSEKLKNSLHKEMSEIFYGRNLG